MSNEKNREETHAKKEKVKSIWKRDVL